jgi:2-polyprenyl-3-methyl-5-hydroxy-6-metoxy-1,4-benzoquinol methylase
MRLPAERENPVWQRLRAHDIEELWDPSINPHVAATYAARLSLVEELIRRACPLPATVIDIGCAQGTLGLRLAEQGYAVTLVDVRPEALEYARARWEHGSVEYIVGGAGDVAGTGRRFDVVVCTEVLEHVPQPAELLGVLSSLVRSGGILMLTTPNADYALSRLPSFGSASQEVVDTAEPNSMDGDAHRYLFTLEELVALVRGVGLKVESAGFALPFWLEGHLKTRLAHRLLQRTTGHIVSTGRAAVRGGGPVARRTRSCVWLVARRG